MSSYVHRNFSLLNRSRPIIYIQHKYVLSTANLPKTICCLCNWNSNRNSLGIGRAASQNRLHVLYVWKLIDVLTFLLSYSGFNFTGVVVWKRKAFPLGKVTPTIESRQLLIIRENLSKSRFHLGQFGLGS